jgi:hypothetical protein
MYSDALIDLSTWFHAVNNINYARWILVYLKGMAELSGRNTEVARKFKRRLL